VFASNTVLVSNAVAPPKSNGLSRLFRTNSTPDRLRLHALLTVVVIVAVGAVSWLLTERLVGQTIEVADNTGEVLVATQQVSSSFAEADAAAVSVHLAGAVGNPEQRRLYEQATDRATAALERIARLVGDDERSHEALQNIAADTTAYAGLIEQARSARLASQDQRFFETLQATAADNSSYDELLETVRSISSENLGAANELLGEASSLNRDQISPEVAVIASRARDRFDGQTSTAWYLFAIILLALGLVAVLVAHVALSRKFHRTINIPLALAALVLLALIVGGSRGFISQQQAFSNAESEAFDAIQLSEQIQQVAFRHRSASTEAVLTLRSTDELASLESELGGLGGLLSQARAAAGSPRERAAAETVVARWQRYVNENAASQQALERYVAEGDSDQRQAAESITQGSANSAFNGFNTSIEAALLDNREQFLSQLNLASQALRGLRLSILVGALLAAVLSWWGFAQRIGEYR